MSSAPLRQLAFDLGHRSASGREDFFLAPSNKDAVAWIDSWPSWPAPALVMHGPAASGKSHLAAVWAARTGAAFIEPDLLAAREADHLFAQGPHLALDHLDPWIGDRAAETTLFHLYNMAKENRRSLLVIMRTAPSLHDFAVADLASRLRAAPAAAIHPPDDTLLAALLIKLFADRQLQVQEETVRYILPRMERSFAAAYQIVAEADALALAERRKISIPLLRDLMTRMSRENYREPGE